MLLAAAAAEPATETLERAAPGASAALQPAVAAAVVALDGDAVRFRHPLYAQAVLGLAAAAEVRAANVILAGATTSPDARARHLGLAADGPDEGVALPSLSPPTGLAGAARPSTRQRGTSRRRP